MKFTGPASDLPTHPTLSQAQQEDAIFYAAAVHGVQATFLAAIRIAEGGGPGREFGVLSEKADEYEEQADICARSIRNSLFRFVAAHGGAWPTDQDTYSPSFIVSMAERWAPRKASNDPNDLNRHWVRNVTAAYVASGIAR